MVPKYGPMARLSRARRRKAGCSNPVLRLLAARLLGYQSPATRRNYALDMTAWLGFCDGRSFGP